MTGRHRLTRLVVTVGPLLVLAFLTGCARNRYVSVPLGRAELGFGIVEENGLRYLELARPACVAQLDVLVVDPAFSGPPHHAFLGRFPPAGTGERCHDAGRVALPLLGNRRRVPQRTSLPALVADPGRRIWRMELYVASDVPVDAHRLAYALNEASALDDSLAVALWEGDMARAGRRVEALIADQPGSPLWAGLLRDVAR